MHPKTAPNVVSCPIGNKGEALLLRPRTQNGAARVYAQYLVAFAAAAAQLHNHVHAMTILWPKKNSLTTLPSRHQSTLVKSVQHLRMWLYSEGQGT